MRRPSLTVLAVLSAFAVVAGCGSDSNSGSSSKSSAYGGSANTSKPATSSGAATLKATKGKLGTFITDGKGLTLYLFEKDTGTTSSCSGECDKVWAPLTTSGAPKAASGVTAAMVSTTKRSDGTTQVTYGGHPLYHYDDDHKPGQTEGQGSKEFGAGWYVVAPSGKKIDSD